MKVNASCLWRQWATRPLTNKVPVQLPAKHGDFSSTFITKKADYIPPHCLDDSAVSLVPGTSVAAEPSTSSECCQAPSLAAQKPPQPIQMPEGVGVYPDHGLKTLHLTEVKACQSSVMLLNV